jgi:hypothetical protein
VLGYLDSGDRFLLESMDDPDLILDLHSINNPESVPPERQGNLKNATAQPFMGFAISAFPPSAAMVSAEKNDFLCPCWKVRKGFSS